MIDYEEATHGVTGYAPHETPENRRSISFSFSLQIITHEGEGLSLKGDASVQKTSTIPQRASAKPVPVDIELRIRRR